MFNREDTVRNSPLFYVRDVACKTQFHRLIAVKLNTPSDLAIATPDPIMSYDDSFNGILKFDLLQQNETI